MLRKKYVAKRKKEGRSEKQQRRKRYEAMRKMRKEEKETNQQNRRRCGSTQMMSRDMDQSMRKVVRFNVYDACPHIFFCSGTDN
jgi:hypothetical protein